MDAVFEVGSLVFARVKGYRPWPGKCILCASLEEEYSWNSFFSCSEVEKISRETSKVPKYEVFFFGTSQLGVCSAKDVFPYHQYKGKFAKKVEGEKFIAAINEIEEEVRYAEECMEREASQSVKVSTKGMARKELRVLLKRLEDIADPYVIAFFARVKEKFKNRRGRPPKNDRKTILKMYTKEVSRNPAEPTSKVTDCRVVLSPAGQYHSIPPTETGTSGEALVEPLIICKRCRREFSFESDLKLHKCPAGSRGKGKDTPHRGGFGQGGSDSEVHDEDVVEENSRAIRSSLCSPVPNKLYEHRSEVAGAMKAKRGRKKREMGIISSSELKSKTKEGIIGKAKECIPFVSNTENIQKKEMCKRNAVGRSTKGQGKTKKTKLSRQKQKSKKNVLERSKRGKGAAVVYNNRKKSLRCVNRSSSGSKSPRTMAPRTSIGHSPKSQCLARLRHGSTISGILKSPGSVRVTRAARKSGRITRSTSKSKLNVSFSDTLENVFHIPLVESASGSESDDCGKGSHSDDDDGDEEDEDYSDSGEQEFERRVELADHQCSKINHSVKLFREKDENKDVAGMKHCSWCNICEKRFSEERELEKHNCKEVSGVPRMKNKKVPKKKKKKKKKGVQSRVKKRVHQSESVILPEAKEKVHCMSDSSEDDRLIICGDCQMTVLTNDNHKCLKNNGLLKRNTVQLPKLGRRIQEKNGGASDCSRFSEPKKYLPACPDTKTLDKSLNSSGKETFVEKMMARPTEMNEKGNGTEGKKNGVFWCCDCDHYFSRASHAEEHKCKKTARKLRDTCGEWMRSGSEVQNVCGGASADGQSHPEHGDEDSAEVQPAEKSAGAKGMDQEINKREFSRLVNSGFAKETNQYSSNMSIHRNGPEQREPSSFSTPIRETRAVFPQKQGVNSLPAAAKLHERENHCIEPQTTSLFSPAVHQPLTAVSVSSSSVSPAIHRPLTATSVSPAIHGPLTATSSSPIIHGPLTVTSSPAIHGPLTVTSSPAIHGPLTVTSSPAIHGPQTATFSSSFQGGQVSLSFAPTFNIYTGAQQPADSVSVGGMNPAVKNVEIVYPQGQNPGPVTIGGSFFPQGQNTAPVTTGGSFFPQGQNTGPVTTGGSFFSQGQNTGPVTTGGSFFPQGQNTHPVTTGGSFFPQGQNTGPVTTGGSFFPQGQNTHPVNTVQSFPEGGRSDGIGTSTPARGAISSSAKRCGCTSDPVESNKIIRCDDCSATFLHKCQSTPESILSTSDGVLVDKKWFCVKCNLFFESKEFHDRKNPECVSSLQTPLDSHRTATRLQPAQVIGTVSNYQVLKCAPNHDYFQLSNMPTTSSAQTPRVSKLAKISPHSAASKTIPRHINTPSLAFRGQKRRWEEHEEYLPADSASGPSVTESGSRIQFGTKNMMFVPPGSHQMAKDAGARSFSVMNGGSVFLERMRSMNKMNTSNNGTVMALHPESSTEDLGLQCGICSEVAPDVGSLKWHLKIHLRLRRSCNLCCRQFTQSLPLMYHECEKCVGLRCPSCRKLLPMDEEGIETTFTVHVNMCLLEFWTNNSSTCQLCFRQYSTHSGFQRHLNVVHLSPEVYDCTICNVFIGDFDSARRHLRKFHWSSSYTCGLCPTGYATKEMLMRHIKSTHLSGK